MDHRSGIFKSEFLTSPIGKNRQRDGKYCRQVWWVCSCKGGNFVGMNRILLVEDDPSITSLLTLHFQAPAFCVTACDKGATALEWLDKEPFDLIVLDILLPDGNGFEFCKKIRRSDSRTPILMLSALGEEMDKVLALELGADDYLTKPFGVGELMARAKALLRRGAAVGPAPKAEGRQGSDGGTGAEERSESDPIFFRELVIDRQKRKVTVRGGRLELTPKEFDLLWLLAAHPGKTFSRHEVLEIIWGFAFQEYEHTVTSHINRLRIKIESNLNKPEYILTTWGAGYRFAE
jgi:two-component system alkaline phosphatase synthesis response regulator PhoP